jgi:aryl-alcohol dehydrogenase-like predicted oxidoreductase
MSDDSEHISHHLDRREFIGLGVAAGAGLLIGGAAKAPARVEGPLPVNRKTAGAMPTRNLGRTGYRVGVFSLGGQAAVEQPDNEAIAVPIVERALDLGVNYLDTAAMYGREQRWSQRYIGQVMKRRRGETFLASKTHDRTRDGSLELLEESLRLLQTDHLDLWQVHNLSRLDQVEKIFAKGGAMEALQEARDQKLVRHLGVTGHADPKVLIEAIRRFDFDTLLLALNAADPHHLSFAADLLPLAVEKRMGIIGMKIPARGRLLSGWTPPPVDEQREVERPARTGTITMRDALYYVLSLPVSTVIVGCDSIAQLEENVALARAFTPFSQSQLEALTARAEPVAKQALFFRSWT